MANCVTCRWYHDDPSVRGFDGTCRRRAPTITNIPMLYNNDKDQGPLTEHAQAWAWSIFPPVLHGLWCGEYEAKANAQ